jgi:hypothetical protein
VPDRKESAKDIRRAVDQEEPGSFSHNTLLYRKHQIPCLPAGRQASNSKKNSMIKIRSTQQNWFGHWKLELGDYLGFEIYKVSFWVNQC